MRKLLVDQSVPLGSGVDLVGQITGATVVDINAIVRDPASTDKWRSDGGAWTDDGTHYSVYAAPLIAAQMDF